jgi:hypothetical protein
MMFELIAAAVVAVFLGCLYLMVGAFFRDVEEIGSRLLLRRLATARRSVNKQQKAQRRPSGV